MRRRRPAPLAPPTATTKELQRRLASAVRGVGVLGPRAAPLLASTVAAAGGAVVRSSLHGSAAQQRAAADLASALLGVPAQLAPSWSRVDDASALRLARAVASAAHVAMTTRWDAGIAEPQRRMSKGVTAKVAAAERAYVARLAALRRALGAADAGRALAVVDAALVDAVGDACFEAAQVAHLRSKPAANAAVTASGLARRTAMLAAAAVLSANAIAAGGRSARTTAKQAEGASRLRRRPLEIRFARTTIGAADQGRLVTVVGRINDVDFVERPRKPYSRATLHAGGPELRVPRRNMRRVGVTSGSWVCARGDVKVEGEGDRTRRYIEVEFEGPGTHRKTVFEDWAADLARPAYDLYPGVLLMEWQLPARGERGAAADVLSRVRSA